MSDVVLLCKSLLLTGLRSVMEYTYLLFWNSFWTIAPVIAMGIFDRNVGMYRCV